MSNIQDALEVQDFIWRLNNRMIRIASEANNIFTDDSKENLATKLAKAVSRFEYSKPMTADGSDPSSVILYRVVIAEAYAHGVIIDTDFEKLQQELNQKDAEIAKLRKQNNKFNVEATTKPDAKDSVIAELTEKLQKVATDLVYWRGRYDELDIRLKGMFKHREGDDITGV